MSKPTTNLDITRLPVNAREFLAFYSAGDHLAEFDDLDLLFGLWYQMSRSEAGDFQSISLRASVKRQDFLTTSHNLALNLAKAVKTDPLSLLEGLTVPAGCRLRVVTKDDQNHVSDFVAVWLEVPHSLNWVLDSRQPIPQEMSYLLSAHLLTGAEFNFANFDRISLAEDLDFLPFVVTNKAYRYFLTNQSFAGLSQAVESLTKAISIFERYVLVRVGANNFFELVRRAYAIVRFNEVWATLETEPQPDYYLVRGQDYHNADFIAGSLSVLLEDLPSPPQAIEFDPEYFSK